MEKNLEQFHSQARQNLQKWKIKITLDVSFKTWLNMLIILNTPLLHEYKLLSELKAMSTSKNVFSQTFWKLIMFQFLQVSSS